MIIEEAVEILAATYMPLETVALGLPIDAHEAEKALADSDPASVEYVCLKALVKAHPIPVIAPEPIPEE
jgi:hypothetical protein